MELNQCLPPWKVKANESFGVDNTKAVYITHTRCCAGTTRRNAQDGQRGLDAVHRDDLSEILLYNKSNVTLTSLQRSGQRTDGRIVVL